MSDLLKGNNRTYLMGIAILWIIGLHFYMYSAFPSDSIWGILFSKGYLGVDIFLFLSAYGLCYSFNSNSLKTFYARRLRRLFPVYFVFLALMIAFWGKTYEEPDWLLFLLQSTGVASFRQTDFEWYVPALVVLYIAFPLLYKGISVLYHKNKYLVLIVILLLASFSSYTSKVLFPMFAYRLPIIVLGVTTFLATKADDKNFTYLTFAACAFSAIAFFRGSCLPWSLLMPGFLALLALAEVDFPFKKPVCFIGEHSLEIYLAQSFALNQFFYKSGIPYFQKCVIAFLMLIVLAFLFYYIQKLFYHFIRQVIRNKCSYSDYIQYSEKSGETAV